MSNAVSKGNEQFQLVKLLEDKIKKKCFLIFYDPSFYYVHTVTMKCLCLPVAVIIHTILI